MKKYIIFQTTFIFYLFFLNFPSYAIDLTGVRPLGMGGAFVARADDENSVAWNPAGMKEFDTNRVQTSYNIRDGYKHPMGSLFIVNSKDRPLLDGGVGVSRHRTVIKGEKYEKSDVIIALADQYTSNFSIGISGKYIKEKKDNQRQNGYTYDAGAIYKISDKLKVAIVGYNLSEPQLASYKRKLQVGLSLDLFEIVRLSSDGAKLYTDNSDGKYNYYFGGEIAITKKILIRGGYSEEKIYDNKFLTGGIEWIILDTNINYAFIQYLENELSNSHMLAFSYTF